MATYSKDAWNYRTGMGGRGGNVPYKMLNEEEEKWKGGKREGRGTKEEKKGGKEEVNGWRKNRWEGRKKTRWQGRDGREKEAYTTTRQRDFFCAKLCEPLRQLTNPFRIGALEGGCFGSGLFAFTLETMRTTKTTRTTTWHFENNLL